MKYITSTILPYIYENIHDCKVVFTNVKSEINN